MIEKWEDRKDLVLSHMCLVGRMKKWRDEKLICLVEKKNESMENEVGIMSLLNKTKTKSNTFFY